MGAQGTLHSLSLEVILLLLQSPDHDLQAELWVCIRSSHLSLHCKCRK